MPLGLPIFHVDKDQKIRSDMGVKVSDHKRPAPPPTPQYFPTMKIVRCIECKGVGILEFVNGFSLTEGDKVMGGKPTKGLCLRCRKETEMHPIDLPKNEERELKLLYGIQQSLDEAVRRGERMGPNATVWPLARIKAYEAWLNSRSKNGR